MSAARLHPLSIGEILDGTFTLYRRHFLPFFLTALIPFAPLALGYALLVNNGAIDPAVATDPSAASGSLILILLGSTFGGVFALAALTHLVSRAFTGHEVSVGDGFAQGLRSTLPLIAAVIVAYLAMLIAFLGLTVISALIAIVLAFGKAAGVVVGAVLTVLVVIVGSFFIMTAFFGVVPAVVVERLGPFRAVGRSWRLARGARLRIVAVVVIAWIIMMLPTVGVMMAAGMGMALFDPSQTAAMSSGQIYLQQGIASITGALTFPFFAGCIVLLYYDRRIRTEGYDLEVATDALAPAR